VTHKWYDTKTCNLCGFEITGLPRDEHNKLTCPECGRRADPETERIERLAEIRRFERRQLRVLMFLAVLGVSIGAVLLGAVMIVALLP